MRRVRKIKIDTNAKIIIDWDLALDDGTTWDEYHMRCSDLPRPEFFQALAEIGRDVLELLEFPSTWLGDIKVRGVTYTYSDKGNKGVVITAVRDLNKSSRQMNLVTPCFLYDSDNPDTFTIPYFTLERLNKLEEEAERYIDGDRAQGSLFDAPEEPQAEAAEESQPA
nr:MAG TPA_asm: hypothetical protein [Caudoviricetes sp.]